MRIAHITDLHVARPPAWGEYNVKRTFGWLNHLLFRRRRYRESVAAAALHRLAERIPDLVILTGDITQLGLDSEFAAAKRLLAIFGERHIPVVVVAGNHDVYGKSVPSCLSELRRASARDIFSGSDGIIRFPGVELLPLAQEIFTPPFFSYGRQDMDELIKASSAWSKPANKVMRLVCGHYPVIDAGGGRLRLFRGLRNAGALIDFCREHQVAGYFCGHNHKRFSVSMPGGCMQFAAPALSGRGGSRVSVYECGPEHKYPLEIQTGVVELAGAVARFDPGRAGED